MASCWTDLDDEPEPRPGHQARRARRRDPGARTVRRDPQPASRRRDHPADHRAVRRISRKLSLFRSGLDRPARAVVAARRHTGAAPPPGRRTVRGIYDLQTSARSSRYFRLLPQPRPEWSGIAAGCSHPDADPRRDALHTIERQAGQLRAAGIANVPPPDLSWVVADAARFALPTSYGLLAPAAPCIGPTNAGRPRSSASWRRRSRPAASPRC